MKWLGFFCLLLFTNSAYALECWSKQELTKYSEAEVDDLIIFSIKDAVNCAPVVLAEVTFGEATLHTDENGEFKIHILTLRNLKKIGFSIKKPKYIPYEKELEISLGTIKENRYLIMPETE